MRLLFCAPHWTVVIATLQASFSARFFAMTAALTRTAQVWHAPWIQCHVCLQHESAHACLSHDQRMLAGSHSVLLRVLRRHCNFRESRTSKLCGHLVDRRLGAPSAAASTAEHGEGVSRPCSRAPACHANRAQHVRGSRRGPGCWQERLGQHQRRTGPCGQAAFPPPHPYWAQQQRSACQRWRLTPGSNNVHSPGEST